jgi:hypothetical protein
VGYVIAAPNPSGNPTEVGIPAFLGFWRTTDLSEPAFVSLVNVLPARQGQMPFNDSNTDLAIGQIKQICSDNFNKNLHNLTKVKDEFWVYNTKKTDDNEIISSTNGLEYDLFVE